MAKKTNGADRPRLRKPHVEQALPGMEDVKVRSIQEALGSIAEIRAQKNELISQEQAAMQRLMNLMRKHEKQACRAHGVEAVIVPGEAKLRVRTSKEQATDVDDEDELDEDALDIDGDPRGPAHEAR